MKVGEFVIGFRKSVELRFRQIVDALPIGFAFKGVQLLKSIK